jgi:hypothetical protein
MEEDRHQRHFLLDENPLSKDQVILGESDKYHWGHGQGKEGRERTDHLAHLADDFIVGKAGHSVSHPRTRRSDLEFSNRPTLIMALASGGRL